MNNGTQQAEQQDHAQCLVLCNSVRALAEKLCQVINNQCDPNNDHHAQAVADVYGWVESTADPFLKRGKPSTQSDAPDAVVVVGGEVVQAASATPVSPDAADDTQ